MSDSDYSDVSTNITVDDDYIQNDDTVEREEDAYFEEKETADLIDESTMITNTDLYAFAEEFIQNIENQTLLWPVPMLKIIKFLSDKSIEYHSNDRKETLNYEQVFDEVNLVMIMLMLKVPVQLDIELRGKMIDLNGERKISYKKQPFHEPFIILELLKKNKVITDDIIRDDVKALMQ